MSFNIFDGSGCLVKNCQLITCKKECNSSGAVEESWK